MSLLKPDSPIEYLKGVGPQKAALLKKELGIQKIEDLLFYFPFRYIDKSHLSTVSDVIHESDYALLKLKILGFVERGNKRNKILIVKAKDDTGTIDLTWFRSHAWVQEKLISGNEYLIFGKVQNQGYGYSIPHPEIEEIVPSESNQNNKFVPVYNTTELLSSKNLNSRAIARLTENLIKSFDYSNIQENLPEYIITKFKLKSRGECLRSIHYPRSQDEIYHSQQRFKFEELFHFQLVLAYNKSKRKKYQSGYNWSMVGELFNEFYSELLPFKLTEAQKKVIREIREDLRSGRQMNRLLQGDVGSGKTIVAFLIMLMAAGNGFQSCLMAPTEILANQHYTNLVELSNNLPIQIQLLTGNTKNLVRKKILEDLQSGHLNILVGTHALIEDPVVFNNLGLVVIDEQHRFGVDQRSKLWAKSKPLYPHVLIMSATPIPRTLAMTQYGDLDVSIIDELPPGRKNIITRHLKDFHRMDLYRFMKEQIQQGRQIYIVYPLIEESDTLQIENLQLGYEKLLEYFPIPQFQISVVHGKLKPKDKEMEMQRFASGKSQIMVATTVIEVGVNVPNATVMVIENAERFGLSQLHQLRGRVGRGSDQSYCILMTADHIGKDAVTRMKVLCSTNDGFKIAEEDLKLRGPGDLSGTRQSGLLELQLANIVKDAGILHSAHQLAQKIIDKDPLLNLPINSLLKQFIGAHRKRIHYSEIS